MGFLSLIGFVAKVAFIGFGYWQARKFVQTKLRFVDAVHSPMAPLLAGLGAAVIISPLTLVPFIGLHAGTALLFGVSVAVGVVNGARDVRRRIGSGA